MEHIFDIVVTLLGVATIGQYVWSTRAHFRSQKMASGAVAVSIAVIVTALLFLVLTWTRVQPVQAHLSGIAVMLASMVLFWWAIIASRKAQLRFAFDPENPHGLVTDGPYRYLRHPFYTSYVIFWVGWAIATASWEAAIPVVILVILYVKAALMEEEKFANSPLAVDYAAYRERTGFFWPRLTV